jgi:hypothetical protein
MGRLELVTNGCTKFDWMEGRKNVAEFKKYEIQLFG